jgi:hypothetical protein
VSWWRKPKTVASLFIDRPEQWGLRGDPHLWNEMAERFASTPCPPSPMKLGMLLEEMFVELTGHPLSTPNLFYIERYDSGGMSGGCIWPEFWREKGIPLLISRFRS